MSHPQQTIWPLSRDYVEAVQTPRSCFVDSDLQDTVPAIDRLGMPIVSSGQFAYVFKLNKSGGSESIAVRCFRGFLGERDKRYKAIDGHLDHHSLAALAKFEYEASGIRVNGSLFPLLVMEWVDGPTLDVYLDNVLSKREVVLHLADQWIKLFNSLKEAQIAHGDLQHGNIIVQSGALRLVDFDGMFVPSMMGWNAIELGHRHYQHPLRNTFFFDDRLDNFSALVIYLSLIAAAERPELWAEYHDENLLFKRDDFLKPAQSRLFAKVRAMGGEHRRLGEILEKACASSPAACPHLLDLVSPKSKLPAWMVAPVGTVVQTRTREVLPGQIPQTSPVPTRVRQTPAPVTSQQGTPQVQTTPAATVPQARAAPLDWEKVIRQGLKKAVGVFIGSLFLFWLWTPVLGAIYVGMGGAQADAQAFAFIADIVICAAIGIHLARKEQLKATRASWPVSAPSPVAYPLPSYRSGSRPVPTPSSTKGPVVGSLIRHIYHRPNCEWALKISARNRTTFSSTTEAQNRGYRRCRVCLP